MTKKEFEKKYNLIPANDPLLNNKLELFDFRDPPVDPEELGKDLLEHMRYFGGIGLSANQLGMPYRVFVMEGSPGFICFNPRISAFAGDEVQLDEGCLSYPGLYVKKKRPGTIRVSYVDEKGFRQVKKFQGLSARIFQHEMEHMDGNNFLEGIGPLALQMAKQRQDKLLKKVRRDTKRAKRAQKKNEGKSNIRN